MSASDGDGQIAFPENFPGPVHLRRVGGQGGRQRGGRPRRSSLPRSRGDRGEDGPGAAWEGRRRSRPPAPGRGRHRCRRGPAARGRPAARRPVESLSRFSSSRRLETPVRRRWRASSTIFRSKRKRSTRGRSFSKTSKRAWPEVSTAVWIFPRGRRPGARAGNRAAAGARRRKTWRRRPIRGRKGTSLATSAMTSSTLISRPVACSASAGQASAQAPQPSQRERSRTMAPRRLPAPAAGRRRGSRGSP